MCMTGSYGEMRSPSYSARTSSPSYGCAHSLRIAIASSIPPSQASFFWKICINTRGWRPSRSSVSRAWLKYASVYQPARIFSTGRSKISGFSRARVASVRAMFERETRRERSLCDLELLRRRLRGRQTMLQFVARLRRRLRDDVVGVTRHPAEDLGRGSDRSELRSRARSVAERLGCETCERVPDRARREQRADEMAAAALVLLRRRVAVLVAADRDVLGAVVRRKLAAAQRERSRREREQGREKLLRGGPEPGGLPDAAHDDGRTDHRREHALALHRQPRSRERMLHLRQERKRLGEARRAAQERARHVRGAEPLVRGCDRDLAALRPDRARPRRRPVDEHAVRQGHAAQAELLVSHRRQRIRRRPAEARPGAHAPPSRRRAPWGRRRRRASPRVPRTTGRPRRPRAGARARSGPPRPRSRATARGRTAPRA